MSHNNTVKGYSEYKVANDVKHHYAVGLGVYDVFINTNGAEIFLDNAISCYVIAIYNKTVICCIFIPTCVITVVSSPNPCFINNSIVKGYSAYKVANDVKHHYAVGLGVYDVFINTNGAEIFLDNAISCYVIAIYNKTVICCIFIPTCVITVVSSPNPCFINNSIVTVNNYT